MPHNDKVPSAPEADRAAPPASSRSVVKLAHYLLAGVLLGGAFGYWLLKPAGSNPVAEPRAAEAMALVQTHQAIGAPTIRQAIDERVRTIESQGRGVRVGEWRVQQEQGPFYLVRVVVREEGERAQWFEREYVWRADTERKKVVPLSLHAELIMPVGAEKRQLPNLGPSQ